MLLICSNSPNLKCWNHTWIQTHESEIYRVHGDGGEEGRELLQCTFALKYSNSEKWVLHQKCTTFSRVYRAQATFWFESWNAQIFNETSQKPQSEVITALHHLQVEKTFFTTPTPNVWYYTGNGHSQANGDWSDFVPEMHSFLISRFHR